MSHRLYRITSIGRPLDPAYPTNKAVLMIMPVAAALAGTVAAVRGAGPGPAIGAGLTGLLVIFGAWALARELAPDDNPAAFVGMALAYVVLFFTESPSVLLLFTTLFLVRIVNRSVGVPARPGDSAIVALLTLWAIFATQSPLLGVIAALAFALDALPQDGLGRQWAFAAVCLVCSGVYVVMHGLNLALATAPNWAVTGMVVATGILFAITMLRTRRVESVGDLSETPLSPSRVRGGMLIGLLVACQALLTGTSGIDTGSLLWATLAGVVLGGLKR